MLGLNFKLESYKTADFIRIVLALCRLVRYKEKYEEKREKKKSRFVFLSFTTAKILTPTFNKCGTYFCGNKGPCRVLN